MSLSFGISRLALLTPAAGTTTQSVCSSSSSQIWQQPKSLERLSLSSTARSNSRGGSSRQLHQVAAMEERTFARKGSSSAEYAADKGGLSEEDFADRIPLGYSAAASSRVAPTQRNDGKFWRRFPGQKQGDQDVIVPAEALRRGAVFRGTVSSIQPFGAFVNLGAFADGLIHISKLGKGYVKDVNDVVELGQEVMVSIVNMELATGRISLSLVDEDERNLRKPYVSPRREEAGQRGDRPRFQSGSSGRSGLSMVEKEGRGSRGSYASSSKSMESRQRGERHRYQQESGGISHSMPEEEQERVSRISYASSRQMETAIRDGRRAGNQLESGGIFQSMLEEELDKVSGPPYASSRPQKEARREGGGPRFQPGSGGRSPFVVKEEKENARNPSASARLGKAGEESRMYRSTSASPRHREAREESMISRNPFTSSRQWEAREEDRVSRNPFTSSRQWEPREEERVSRNPFTSSRQWEAREEERVSKNPFTSSRQWEAIEEGRVSKNSFASSRQSEAGEGDGTSRNPYASSRQREATEEGNSPRFQQEGSEGEFLSRASVTQAGSGAGREGQKRKPKMKLVQIRTDSHLEDNSMEDNKVSLGMRNVMRGWYECDCC